MRGVVYFQINSQHLKEQGTTQTWSFCSRILSKGFFFLFFFFFNFLSPRPAFLVCRPLSVPHIPLSCPLYSELWPEHWPWTLTSPVISHIPGPFPPLRPQTAHHSSPPPFPASSSCSLFVPRLFSSSSSFHSHWIQNGKAGFWWGAARRQRRVNTALAAEQQTQSPTVSYPPRSTALSVNLWSDLELMSKWWCQPVRTGQLSSGAPMRQANSPNLGHTPPVCFQLCHSLFPFTYVWIVGEVLLINTDRSIWKETESESIWTWRRFQRFWFE